MMKNTTKLKAIALSLLMACMLLPMNVFAQRNDNLFRVDEVYNGTRDNEIAFTGLYNQTFGNAPLGSGLLVLGALGAGYAIARRKRNKKGAALLLALALTLGFTQCKKKVEQVVPVNANKVNITLNVDGRHIVTPGAENATVTYEDGDKIYVGDGTHYIGTLTRTSGAFSGEIVEPADGTKIDFFFVGGLEPSVTPTASTTTDFTVNISNQSSNLPVLSCGSAEYYHGTTEYNCELKNKCALVELTLTSGTTDAVGIGDRYTQATINFGGTPGIAPNTSTTGMITMKPSGEDNTKKYAILLPQAAVAGSAIAIGHVGYTLDVPAMSNNNYIKFNNEGAAASNIVYLNYLTTNYTATNGQTFTGRLDAANYPVKISIADGATVTLDGITINGVNNSSYNWAGLNCEGNATIILKDGTTNTVSGFYESYPGIHVPKDKTLTIQGTGTLNANSRAGAGIGGGYKLKCGNILIEGGTINADSHYGAAAGIGGGRDASCGNITITGGTVTAIGGAAGIGTGSRYDSTTSCGNISITGGTVVASTGAYNAAGIGTAGNGQCGSITITSGVTSVTATKGPESYNSIGKGWSNGGSCSTVTIEGVEYWKNNGYTNNGSDYLTRSTLVYPVVTDLSTITEDYTASFRETLTGTLGKNVKISIADGHTVTLDGVSINASGTWTTGDYAGITCQGDATIVLKDGSANIVKGFDVKYPGISVPNGKTLIIKGETAPGTGSLNASSNAASSDNFSGAGIGGHYTTACGNIEIQGGNITATCTGKYGAGIGGGGGNTVADCGTITISGGTVTANGGGFAAGIGSGTDGDCGAITITSGVTSVTANRGSGSSYDCIGRGNGASSTCSMVTIGGTVYWDGSAYQNDGEAHIKQSSLTYQP